MGNEPIVRTSMSHSYLLDTCAWLDFHVAPALLKKSTIDKISKAESLHIATISMLEVTRKASIGKLQLNMPIDQWLDLALPKPHFRALSISPQIAMDAYQLPGTFHNDPADRLIVATARVHNLTLFTSDIKILEYPHVKSVASR